MKQNENLPDRIVFYDGDCGFCNTAVQFVLNHRKCDIYFAPLQSALAKNKLADRGITIQMNTLYFLENGKLFTKSTGALRIAKYLKGMFPMLYIIGMLCPRFVRDWVYDQVAKYRHKIRPGACALPSQEEKKLFL
jgi:predicted DCC family thiol-disulfide oxidoreductase YuxK